MIELLFGTADTDLATGRAKVLASLNAQASARGLGSLFPTGLVFPGCFDIPTSALASVLTAPQRSALVGDTLRINVADGLITQPGLPDGQGNPTTVVTGYGMELLIALRLNDQLVTALGGILSARWTVKATTTRPATARELQLDPGRPSVAFKDDGVGVQFQHVVPRVRKRVFLGAP